MLWPNKNFILTVRTVDANVQYLRNVVLSFEKGPNGQNNSPLGSHQLIKKSPSP